MSICLCLLVWGRDVVFWLNTILRFFVVQKNATQYDNRPPKPQSRRIQLATKILNKSRKKEICAICLEPTSSIYHHERPNYKDQKCWGHAHKICVQTWTYSNEDTPSKFHCHICKQTIHDCDTIGFNLKKVRIADFKKQVSSPKFIIYYNIVCL